MKKLQLKIIAHKLSHRETLLAMLFAATSAFSTIVSAKDGRDFAGFYNISNVNELGESTSLTLKVRIFNYSEGPVSGATVFLEDPLLLFVKYGELGVMTVNERESFVLLSDFSISSHEYEGWQQGLHPSILVEYQNVDGQTIHRSVEIINQPFSLEE